MPNKQRFFKPDPWQEQRPAWIRLPLLCLLLVVLVFLYWRAFSNKLSDLEAQSLFMDQSGTWSLEDRRVLADRARLFEEQWGLQVIAHVFAEQPVLPELGATTLFIGASAKTGEALIVLPGLASRAYKQLSEQAGYDLRLALQDQLAICMNANKQQTRCVLDVLDSVNTTLSGY